MYVMVLVREKKGTFKLDSKANTGIIYVPADITKDSGFPLIPRNVKIRIEDNHLVIEPLPRFEHLNTYEDSVIIIDNRLGRQAEIYFREDETAYCNLCEETDCEHIDYILSTEEVINPIRSRGWRGKK